MCFQVITSSPPSPQKITYTIKFKILALINTISLKTATRKHLINCILNFKALRIASCIIVCFKRNSKDDMV